MPNLADLTDYDPQSVIPEADGIRRVYITGNSSLPVDNTVVNGAPEAVVEIPVSQPSRSSSLVNSVINKLFRDDDQRYQLWPEKIVREALTGANAVMKEGSNLGLRREDVTDIPAPSMPTKDSTWLGEKLGIAPVYATPQDSIIEKAQAISALAGTGGLAGTESGAVLNATPSLRPALKYKDRLYKGKEGQQHMDVIPKELYPEFEKMAMSGEDISHYNFGFINDKGQFLTREKALEYGINTGLIDPHAGKFGALTSTLMADSSKPGTAIEAMAQSRKFDFSKPSAGTNVAKIGDTEIIYGVGKNNDVELTLIKTPKDKRGEGSARAALEQFTKEADEAGKRIMLNADPMDKATSKSGLVDFYKSLGFVRNAGNKRDFSTRAEYIREPVIKADSSKEGAAIQANKPTFYSAVEHNLNAIPQSKMTGEQWLGTLSNKPGVKGEELDWTGLKGFLEENKGKPVTKEQIQEHLASNKVELKEVTREHSPAVYDENTGMPNKRLNENQLPTKYHSYQLPGGENYREVLLTLPKKTGPKEAEALAITKRMSSGEFNHLDEAGRAELFKKLETLNKEKNAEVAANSPYKSSHWDEPNILAHVRMNDRTIDGKKSLHLEEIQSDWHQQGRDKGYKSEGSLAKFNELYKQQEEAKAELSSVMNKVIKDSKLPSAKEAIEKGLSQEERAGLVEQRRNAYLKNDRYVELLNKIKSLDEEISAVNPSSKVPDAPFKKSWHELALKRMIREAAEKGYDRLSWTPGEAQAARYDLSKSIDSLHYDPKTQTVKGFKDGKPVVEQKAAPDKLPDIVGKEAAKNLLDTKPSINKTYERYDSAGEPSSVHSLEGQQLKIGGEGMKGFYDQIIPKALEKLGKEHGVKVKQYQVETHKGFPEKISVYDKDVNHVKDFKTMDDARAYLNNPANGLKGGSIKGNKAVPPKTEPVYYIDIPQSLRDTAMHKGFPLFSSTHMFTPVSHDPFNEKSK